MRNFIKIAVILFLCLVLQNCGPKDDTNPDVQMVSEEIKEWGLFKIGTWWVYEEETSKFRDSIFVINYSESVLRPKDFLAFQSISFIIYSRSNYDSFIINSSGIFRGLSLLNLKKKYQEHSAICEILPSPPIIQGSWARTGPSAQITKFDTIYPNLQIGDFNFTNVVRANNNMNLAYDWTPTLIYSAKHIGIVRKEFPEYKQVWNLVRYNIVQ